MSRRTSEASKAIREAWEKERQLVVQGEDTNLWAFPLICNYAFCTKQVEGEGWKEMRDTHCEETDNVL